MYDRVYFMLTFGEARHYTPPGLRPEMAAYTLFVDGISKSLCATGLRVGWAVAPPYITGACATSSVTLAPGPPRPEQVAAAEVLRDFDGMSAFHAQMTTAVRARLDRLYRGLVDIASRHPGCRSSPSRRRVRSICRCRWRCMGASCPTERRSPPMNRSAAICQAAGMAVVPFQAFGLGQESGWMRLSVGRSASTT